MSNSNLYTIGQHTTTKQYHLFNSQKHNGSCQIEGASICGNTHISFGETNALDKCLNEQQAREACALHGRKVCGTCVSNLYGDLE